MQAFTGLPSGNGSSPSAYLPKRGPNIRADANADEPPVNKQIFSPYHSPPLFETFTHQLDEPKYSVLFPK